MLNRRLLVTMALVVGLEVLCFVRPVLGLGIAGTLMLTLVTYVFWPKLSGRQATWRA